MTLNEKHRLHVSAVNNAKTDKERHEKLLYSKAWKQGVDDAKGFERFYIENGADIPTWLGVF